MIRLALAAVLLMGTSACATEAPLTHAKGNAVQNRECDVTVQFGSFAIGIDRWAAAAVEELVRQDPSVTEISRSPYGIEGEYRLCIRTRSTTDAARLFERLKQRLAEPVRAPVTIIGPQGKIALPNSRLTLK